MSILNAIKNVIYIRPAQIIRALVLCVMAQSYMPKGKRFGAIVWGQSGIAKSAMSDGLADQLNSLSKVPDWQTADLNLGGCTPEDISGLPMIIGGVPVQHSYLIPERAYSGRGVLRVDEIDRPTYGQSLVNMIKVCIDRTDRKSTALDWFVLGLGNGCSDSQTIELSEHLRGRMVHLYVSTDNSQHHDEFLSYLQSEDMDNVVLETVRMNPIITRDEYEEVAVYNMRTVHYAGVIIKAYKAMKAKGLDYSDVLLAVLAGVIGKTHALEMIRLMEIDALPSLEMVCLNPDGVQLVKDLSLRQKYLVSLIEKVKSCKQAEPLLTYILRHGDEEARYLIERLMVQCPEISKLAAYKKWTTRMA